MRRGAVLTLAVLAAALGAAPADARRTVDVMVVGREAVLAGPERVVLAERTISVRGKRCAIGARTPLAALAGLDVAFALRDYGACSRRPRDAGQLYVRSVAGERERGSDGWVYKVGRRAGATGAADPGGPFGDGRRLRTGQRVLWFWCVKDAADSCQRTLAISAPREVTAGSAFQVTVRGYDDAGTGVPIEGAAVAPGAVTDAAGATTVTAPPVPGTLTLSAERPGLVPAFPRTVAVR